MAYSLLSGLLLPQRVDEQRTAGGNCDGLPSADRVGHRASRHLAADASLPELRAAPRVEREEVALAPAGEHEIRRRRQDTAVGDVAHLELPLQLAGLGIEG